MKNVEPDTGKNRIGDFTMKKQIIIVLFLASAAFLSGSETAAMWSRLYNRVDTLEYRLAIMENMAEEESRELAGVIATALSETNSARSAITDHNEKRIFDRLQRLSIRKLGDLKAIEAETEIYEALRNSDNLTVKTEAIAALGRLGSQKYIRELSLMLRNLNMRLSGNANMRENEALAYSLVSAFENMGAPETYEPVFYASAGWYSPRSGVRERAKNALRLIMDDPTDILLVIIRKETDFSGKYLALEAQNGSLASDENKAKVAVAGLNEGTRNKTNSISENAELSKIRLLSCRIISNSAYKPGEAVPFLEEMIFTNYDINERLTAIETLGTYTTDDAVSALNRFLRQQNDRQAAGMTQHIDRRAVMATINALGNTGNPLALEELTVVSTIDWPSAVVRAAQAAAEKLKK